MRKVVRWVVSVVEVEVSLSTSGGIIAFSAQQDAVGRAMRQMDRCRCLRSRGGGGFGLVGRLIRWTFLRGGFDSVCTFRFSEISTEVTWVYLAISYTLAPSTWVAMGLINDAHLTNKQHVDFFNTCLPACLQMPFVENHRHVRKADGGELLVIIGGDRRATWGA